MCKHDKAPCIFPWHCEPNKGSYFIVMMSLIYFENINNLNKQAFYIYHFYI